MIDTIQIKQVYKEEDRIKLDSFFSEKLILKSNTEYLHGYPGKSLRATYGNWNFYLTNNYLKIVGSLTTASKNNNLYNSDHEDIKQALDELQQLVCINLDNAYITRLDVAYNFILDEPVYNYFKILDCPEKFKEVEYKDETLQFQNKSKSITFKFYDKVKESKKNKKFLKQYEALNVLRYEMSLNTSGMKKLYLSNLKFEDLYDERIYFDIVNCWFSQYLKIPKIKEYTFPCMDKKGLLGLKEFALKYLISSPKGLDFTKSLLASRELDAKSRYDIKKAITNLNLDNPIYNPLEKELHHKVIRAFCAA